MTKNEIVLLIVVLILYQAYATVLVLKSDDFDDTQKLRQVVFIWLIPFIGAVLVRIALKSVEQQRIMREYKAKSGETES